MVKTIKLLSLCTAIGVVTYGAAVYTFNDKAEKVLANTFKKLEDKSPAQSIKDRFEIKAYKFQVNFLNADKTAQLLNVQYNPLTSNAHLNYESAIEEKIVIEEGKEFSVKFDFGQPKYLFSLKLPRNLNPYQKFSDLLVDENFHISNVNTQTGKSVYNLSISEKGLDIPEIKILFPLVVKAESDISSSRFKRDGSRLTFASDITSQVEVFMGKKIPQIMKLSSDTTLTVNTSAFVNAVLKAEKAGKMEEWTAVQKEDIANEVVAFLKDFKINCKIKDERTSVGVSDKMIHTTSMNNMEGDKVSLSYKMAGTSTSKGRLQTLTELFSDKENVNKVISQTDEQFDIKSLDVREKSATEFENILFKTVASGDDFDYSLHLNLDLQSKGDKTVIDSGKILVQAFEELQVPGEYELSVDWAAVIGENFKISIDGMLTYKDAIPHADLKATFNENSYKALINFVQNLTNAAKGTSFQKFTHDLLVDVKSFPYEASFLPEKNPKTDKQERVLKIQF